MKRHPIVLGQTTPEEHRTETVQSNAISVFGRRYDIGHYRRESETFTVTAYNLDRYSTGKGPGDPGFGVTATGTRAKTGRTIAVDPTVIPYGSLVYIEGIGWRIAEDTGGAIRGHHIDLLVGDRRDAIEFGVKRHCKVTILIPDSSNV
ncbi:3D domain-containing protein [Alicyclobacillus acidiphilus]|uniref:3D domain-containing protein n=1 Tax=Alicyclobacillus acidiphilus TaxID=182455 RepID=UPI001FDF76ED|nr:3D domain-containing protein [Alicyclobacillus acidiphilus]